VSIWDAYCEHVVADGAISVELRLVNPSAKSSCDWGGRRCYLLSKWFCDTSTGAAQEHPVVVLLRGKPLASWLLALGERVDTVIYVVRTA
jgi:hypothetical protein